MYPATRRRDLAPGQKGNVSRKGTCSAPVTPQRETQGHGCSRTAPKWTYGGLSEAGRAPLMAQNGLEEGEDLAQKAPETRKASRPGKPTRLAPRHKHAWKESQLWRNIYVPAT